MPTLAPGNEPDAEVFFERGRIVAKTGNFGYAIEMFIQGLGIAPDAIKAHKELRLLGLQRTADGGKPMGMFELMRLPKRVDAVRAMLNAEKRLAYHPADLDQMVAFIRHARGAGLNDIAEWMSQILRSLKRVQD